MTKPDPSLLEDIVAPKVLDAMRVASAALARAGVRHVVAGALAVGANGHPRATRDADFLVGDEAFEHHPGGVVTLRPGIPIQVDGVPIDLVSIGPNEHFLEAGLEAASGSFLEASPLIYLKLKAGRLQDQADVANLVKAGLDVKACRRYLETHAPDLVARFDELVSRAESE
jgi:hypothetical protein